MSITSDFAAAEGSGVWTRAAKKALHDPAQAVRTAVALMRGQYYRLKFRLLGRKVVIGKYFRVTGPLDIRGPGTVVFGDHCTVMSSRLKPTTPYTHTPDAVIKFGNRVILTRTRLGCESRIEVDDDVGLAEAWLMDSDFHAVELDRGPRFTTRGISKPITIERNAWVGAGAMVLKGVRIGANSVVGAGAVVAVSVPRDTVVFGNPARVVWRLRMNGRGDARATEHGTPSRGAGPDNQEGVEG
jgi:acetyltransferase-like isoleucine patch superfamily enzyme